MKRIILLALPLALALSPIHTMAQAEHESIETTTSGVTITVNGNVVHVSGASGEVMKVFNLTGTEVATIRIEGAEKTVTLNIPKGCYLLKVGKLVRKFIFANHTPSLSHPRADSPLYMQDEEAHSFFLPPEVVPPLFPTFSRPTD